MNEIKKCVDAYQSFIEKLSGGFMNAASEGALTASIGLTHSQISGSFLDRSYFETIKARMRRLSSQDILNPNEQMPTTKLLIEHPDLYQMLALMEKGAHECIHALQKHSYRSVVTLVNAMQTIENWEAKPFAEKPQASQGKRKPDLTCHGNLLPTGERILRDKPLGQEHLRKRCMRGVQHSGNLSASGDENKKPKARNMADLGHH